VQIRKIKEKRRKAEQRTHEVARRAREAGTREGGNGAISPTLENGNGEGGDGRKKVTRSGE